MDGFLAARSLIGHSLAFHILIVALSIGLPVLLSLFEWYAWRKNSERLRAFVRLLAKWTAVFVIGGIFTGTIIALQMSTLWAPFMNEVRPTVGKFFQLEGYMFLIEAAFLSWYLGTMKQTGTLRHFLISIPISIGTIGSAFFITAVNAYMNNSTATLTSTTINEVLHSVASYIFATTLLVLAYVVWRSLHKQSASTKIFLNWTIKRLVAVSAILLVTLALLGHQSAVNIAETQPAKLAAIELLDKTQSNAPLRIGGDIDANGKAEGGIVLPGMLSLLAGYSTAYEVKGLDQVPRYQWPPLIVHLLFDTKMALVGLSSLLVLGAIFFLWRRGSFPRWFSITFIPLSVVGMIMMELGWFITELGRQTWTVAGKQTTAAAFTHGATIGNSLFIFILLFAVLSCATAFALAYTTRHWRATEKTSW